ncbi:hypothetical protein KUV57_12435 [Epibacterium sp. DP7N7-1]|nr:hypothetical protein [Epibacterium sp. DP7N7-1]
MSASKPFTIADVEIRSEIGLTEDQKRRVCLMVLGNGYVDHRGRFTDQVSGESFALKAIHMTLDQDRVIEGSKTAIDCIDEIKFEKTCHVILEDEDGGEHGMEISRGETPASYHFGVLFEEGGEVWFCGRDTVGQGDPSGPMTLGDAPILKRVSTMGSMVPGDAPFDLIGDLPAEGEMWISREEEPSVVSIPWWSGYAGMVEPEAHEERVKLAMQENWHLDQMRERVQALRSETEMEHSLG